MSNSFDEQKWRSDANRDNPNLESEKKAVFLKYLGVVINLLNGSQGSEEELRLLQTVSSQLEAGEITLSDEVYEYYISETTLLNKKMGVKVALTIINGIINLSGDEMQALKLEAMVNEQKSIESQNVSVRFLVEELEEYSSSLPNIEMIEDPIQLQLSKHQKEELINQAQHGVAQVTIDIFSDLNKILARCKTIEEFQSVYPQVYKLMSDSFFPRLYSKVSSGTSDEVEFSNKSFHNEIVSTIQNGKYIKLEAAIRNIPSVNSLDFVNYFKTFFNENQEAAQLISEYLNDLINRNIHEQFDLSLRFDLANHSPKFIIDKIFTHCIDESSKYINNQKALTQTEIKTFIESILKSNIEINISSIFTIANLLIYSNYPSSSNATDPIYRVIYDHLSKVLSDFLIRQLSTYVSFRDFDGLERLDLNAFDGYSNKLNRESPSVEAIALAQNVTERAKNQGLRISLSKAIEVYLQKNIITNIENNIDSYRYSDEFYRSKIETEFIDLTHKIKDFLMRGTDLGDESVFSIKRKLSNYYDTLYLECGKYANHAQIRELIENCVDEVLENHFEKLISSQYFESFYKKITGAIIAKEDRLAQELQAQEELRSNEEQFKLFASKPFIKILPENLQRILWDKEN